MQKALILTYNRFPEGDAGAVRQFSFAKLLSELGYEVFVVGMGTYTGEECCRYKEIEYTSFREKGNDLASRLSNYFCYEKKLKTLLKGSDIYQLILVVDLPYNAMKCIEKYAKKHGSTLIHDSVEWYSTEEFKYGILSPEYLKNDLRNRFFYKSPWKIVGISKFLTEHFERHGLNAIRIPVILDIDSKLTPALPQNEKTVIMYAGNPSKKDDFDQVVIAIEKMDEAVYRQFELRIFGVTDEQFRDNLQIAPERWARLDHVIQCRGRVPREEVLRQLALADYSILFRDSSLRYARAGFPTKIPESMSMGTPVICNLSSDLKMYLKDMENAVISKSDRSDDIYECMLRAIYLPSKQRMEMRKKAYQTMLDHFSWNQYTSDLKKLIEK